MGGTKIKVEEFGSKELKVVELYVGDMLIFRLDLVHVGCEYDKDNVRMHSYMDNLNLKRTKNRTHLVNRE